MTNGPFQRGDVVWHPAPFKSQPAERPFLILSGPPHPFHGTEYAVVGLTRTERPSAIALDQTTWELGDPGEESYVSPWYLFTLKHDNIIRPKGSLTLDTTNEVAGAVASMIGVET
jgi:PemK-like protein.